MHRALQLIERRLRESLLSQDGSSSALTESLQQLDPRYAIEFAVVVAWRAHYGQVRKGGKTPYINHPLTVAKLLIEAGCTQDVVIAGILHDTVEDTATSLAYICSTFGPAVAGIVEGCTELPCDLRWETCKRRHIARIETASQEVQLVTCADKLHNIRTMASQYAEMGEHLWQHFARGQQAQAWYYQSMTLALGRHLQDWPLYTMLYTEVEALFSPF